MSDTSDTPSISLLHDRFGLHEVLGEGTQGRTHRAIDRKTGREVAVKVLTFETVEDWKSEELFEREIEALQSIQHPKIPDYVDAHHDYTSGIEQFYLAQEYVEGTDLEEQLESGETFSEREGRAFVREMLELLEYLHEDFSPPIVHRDIKPSNIMRRDNGELALIDFGAVQTVVPDEEGGTTFLGMGTNGYMAPEQLRGRAEPASDLYAVAATAVHLMSGVHPLEIPMDRMRLQIEEVVDVSDDVEAVLRKMLEPEIEDRYASARDALEALEHGPEADEPPIEGREYLSQLDRAPESPRSRVRATPDRLEIELVPFGHKAAALLSTMVDTVAFAVVFTLLAWSLIEQMLTVNLTPIIPESIQDLPWLSPWETSFDSDLYVTLVPMAWLPMIVWGGVTALWSPESRRHIGFEELFGGILFAGCPILWFATSVLSRVRMPDEAPSMLPPIAYLLLGMWGLAVLVMTSRSESVRNFIVSWFEEEEDSPFFAKYVVGTLVLLVTLPLFAPFYIMPAGVYLIGRSIIGIVRLLGQPILRQYRQLFDIVRPSRELLVVSEQRLRHERRAENDDDWQTTWEMSLDLFKPMFGCFDHRAWAREEVLEENLETSPRSLVPVIACSAGEEHAPTHVCGDRVQYFVGALVGLPYQLLTWSTFPHRDETWRRELEWLAHELETWTERVSQDHGRSTRSVQAMKRLSERRVERVVQRNKRKKQRELERLEQRQREDDHDN